MEIYVNNLGKYLKEVKNNVGNVWHKVPKSVVASKSTDLGSVCHLFKLGISRIRTYILKTLKAVSIPQTFYIHVYLVRNPPFRYLHFSLLLHISSTFDFFFCSSTYFTNILRILTISLLGAVHTQDTLYLFYSQKNYPDLHLTEDDKKVIQNMSKWWTNFAKTGYENFHFQGFLAPYQSERSLCSNPLIM